MRVCSLSSKCTILRFGYRRWQPAHSLTQTLTHTLNTSSIVCLCIYTVITRFIHATTCNYTKYPAQPLPTQPHKCFIITCNYTQQCNFYTVKTCNYTSPWHPAARGGTCGLLNLHDCLSSLVPVHPLKISRFSTQSVIFVHSYTR